MIPDNNRIEYIIFYIVHRIIRHINSPPWSENEIKNLRKWKWKNTSARRVILIVFGLNNIDLKTESTKNTNYTSSPVHIILFVLNTMDTHNNINSPQYYHHD